MILKITITGISLLLIVFICKAQKKSSTYPTETFSVIEAKLANGKPVIGSVNTAYKNYDKKDKYPWCLTINIALDLKNVQNNGLPIKSESDIANKFEDQLINQIKKLTISHYIGHLYNDTFLDVYIYLENPEKVHEYLQSQINKEGLTRPMAYKIEKDPNWTGVKALLK
ncbi:DUF695 domain-containing protein [Mucilaginibacter sp. BJC16-A38]|uniref:DUF695 domain-containing protein n=1 Tax=Mucilaginibacter phenanthrenivorans TaxID=1234842 RepID=UPI00215784D2|nr:DUF695 domain-containing protein [Mucilaginibacter phenanthrenivorans]MCR8557932.1 DUF695 domain-containing protein [Mucilaginibacter phenanthrenivorans]